MGSQHLADNTGTDLALNASADTISRVGPIDDISQESQIANGTNEESDLLVAVWHAQRACLGDSGGGGASKNVSNVLDVTLGIRVQISNHGQLNVQEVVVLHASNSAHARVDTGSWDVLIAVGVDVSGSESERWKTGVDVGEVVVVVGDVELASVLRSVGVGVTDERALPVVGELVPGDSDSIGSVSDIEETIVVVFASDNTS